MLQKLFGFETELFLTDFKDELTSSLYKRMNSVYQRTKHPLYQMVMPAIP